MCEREFVPAKLENAQEKEKIYRKNPIIILSTVNYFVRDAVPEVYIIG